jgi:type IV secretion system protein VirB6
MAIDVFTRIDAQLSDPISDFVTNGVSQLASAATGPLKVAATIYVVLHGYAIMRGLIKDPVMDFAFRALKVVILVALVTQVGTYNEYVKNVFFDALPREIGNALAGGSGSAPTAAAFDKLVQKGWQAGYEIWSQSGVTNPGPALVAALVFFVSGAGTVIAYAISLYAKVALAIVLALGPVFIAFYLFNPTRRFTESWLGQVVNFTVLQVLVIVVLSLILKCADQLAQAYGSSSGDPTLAGLVFCVIFVLAGFVSTQLPGIASGIAGGGAALGLGLAQAAMQAAAVASSKLATRAARSTAAKTAGAMGRAREARWAAAGQAAARATGRRS